MQETFKAGTVTISEVDYIRLSDRDFKLTCLENAGVDNWEGYDLAMEEYELGLFD